MSDKYKSIVSTLVDKAGAKQKIYRKTLEVFKNIKAELATFSSDLSEDMKKKCPDVEVNYTEKGDFESDFKFGGDTLIFLMHTNIFQLPPEHFIHKTKYVTEDPMRSYCGMIMIYNFLSDSIRYSRINDTGYLISRIFINQDGKFFTQGRKQFSYMFKEFGENIMTKELIREILHISVEQAMDFDLMAPPIELAHEITLMQKLQDTGQIAIKTGKRLGFETTDSLKDDK